MNYPLDLRFKIAAIASQLNVKDAAGNQIFYVKQKLFKLKENVEIYKDNTKSQLLYTIKADRIIDFSPLYTLTAANGEVAGTIKRRGAKSLWSATYDLTLNGQPLGTIHESNAWAKLADALFSEIPLLGMFAGYVFHQHYILESPDGNSIGSLSKQPAFFEGKYTIQGDAFAKFDEQSQERIAALLMVVALLERLRG